MAGVQFRKGAEASLGHPISCLHRVLSTARRPQPAMTTPAWKVLITGGEQDDFLILSELFAGMTDDREALDWTPDSESALQTLQQRQHDLCLVVERSGGQAGLKLIRQARAGGLSLPMILLMEDEGESADLLAIQAGATDLLVRGQLSARHFARSIHFALERNRSETEMRKLADFAHFNPFPVLVFAADAALVYCNDAALKMAVALGCDSPAAMLPQEIPGAVKECFSSGKSQLELQTFLVQRTFSWSFFPIPGGNVVHGWVTDLTERHALEAQFRNQQKMQAVGQLAAGVAHDFNNILTIIQGHAAMLADTHTANSPCLRPLREIQGAAGRASNLVRQLLMFSRKQVLQPRSLNLAATIQSSTMLLRRTLGEHIRLQVKMADDLPVLLADPAMIEQMLVSLAVNARDAMPHGGLLLITARLVHLTPAVARRKAEARAGEFVCLSVSDTGCGMAPETLSHVFEPFFTTKEVGKGTGLGLASVYGTVKQHHGWIEAQSELGRGTAFSIYLPTFGPQCELAEPALTPAPPARSLHRSHETVLVVEDEPALRDLVVEILEWHGYRVHSANSGQQALEVYAQHRNEIDLLVTDMVMPGILGSELAERLQKDNPALKVIYTSGYTPGMAGKDLKLLEGCNFLAKPYPPSRLAQFVRASLDAPVVATR